MKSKVSRKNTFKKLKIGSGHDEYQNSSDIENQYDNVRYENIPDIENQLNNDIYENMDIYKNENINNDINSDIDYNINYNIDKPKNIVEYVPLQKETFIEPLEQDIESNNPSDEKIDLGNSGYGIYDKQFYGGISNKKPRIKKSNKSKTNKSKRSKSNKSKSKTNNSKRNKSNKSKRNKSNKSKSNKS
jgi:hypothetical protein